jgi:hypothetical protein
MSRKKIPDQISVGRSELVPYKKGESSGARHDRRKGHALKNKEELFLWCQQHGIKLTITNHGHHWKFVRGDRLCEWWPSSAKFVVDLNYRKGIHVHDFTQARDQVAKAFGFQAQGTDG